MLNTKPCSIPGCCVRVARSKLMCLPHWNQVPDRVQMQVNRTWRAWQRARDVPDLATAYLDARHDAIASVERQMPLR